MGKQKEGSLQERIQELIEKNGGYCFKNHGDMTTEPGRPDIIAGYEGLFIGIEAKVDDNTPSKQQGIHCRNIWKAGNIAFVTWDTLTVQRVLAHISYCVAQNYNTHDIKREMISFMQAYNIDDGTRW